MNKIYIMYYTNEEDVYVGNEKVEWNTWDNL